jgi:hypothetical protein
LGSFASLGFFSAFSFGRLALGLLGSAGGLLGLGVRLAVDGSVVAVLRSTAASSLVVSSAPRPFSP